MIKGIHHVSLKCRDTEEFEKVKEFYINVLGFSVKREWSGGIMIETGNALLEVFKTGGVGPTKGTIGHFAFQTDDMNDISERLKKAGYGFFNGPRDLVIPSEPPLPITVAFIKGPLGEEIEFFFEK